MPVHKKVARAAKKAIKKATRPARHAVRKGVKKVGKLVRKNPFRRLRKAMPKTKKGRER